MNQQKETLRAFCRAAVLAAAVFVTSGIRLVIPVGEGNTALHLGNVMCLLSGLVLGPGYGGLAAGMGSAIYDLTNPLYVASAPFTFGFKFLMAFVAGVIVRRRESLPWNFVGCGLGSVTYTVLYVAKSFFSDLWFKELPPVAAWIDVAPKLAASVVNGVIAVVVAAPLALWVSMALKRAGWAAGKS